MYSNVAIWKLNLTTDGTTPIIADRVDLLINSDFGGSSMSSSVLCGTGLTNLEGKSSVYLFVPICILNNIIYPIDPSATMTVDVTGSGTDEYYDKTYSNHLDLETSKIYESTLTLNQLLRFSVDDGSYYCNIFYYSGEKWADAIANHIDRNVGWEISGGHLMNCDNYLKDATGTNYIDPDSFIDVGTSYKWEYAD